MAVEPRPAATVVLVRDSLEPGGGVEVLMVLRPAASRFAPGVYVFPGGRVEESDWAEGLAARCTGLDGAEAARRMPDVSPPGRALGAWVAAARETFEEVGILLAFDAAGPPGPPPASLTLRLEAHRKRLHAGAASLPEILAEERLRLATEELHYFAHWITPEACPIRYSVRFFLARAPEGQAARHDGVELIDHRWVRPRDALERWGEGTFPLAFPTRILLGELSGFADVGGALRWARDRVVATVLSRIVRRGGVPVEVLPGEEAVDSHTHPTRGGAEMKTDKVLTSVDGPVCTITLNRPESFNALDQEAAEGLLEALEGCADERVRVVVLRGAGKAFCTGGDLGHLAAGGNLSAALGNVIAVLNRIVLRVRGLPKPVVAAVNGVTAGGGMGLALACDLRIVSDKAKFRQAFTGAGLAPDTGWSVFAPLLVGLSKASELAFLDPVIDAQEAHRIGIANRVVEADRFDGEVADTARKLASGATLAFGEAKALLNRAAVPGLEALLEQERQAMIRAGTTRDAAEGVAAFLEKRSPAYAGS